MIQISLEEYRSLLESSWLLEALEDYGVDNWGWYSDAYSAYIDRKDAEHNQED